MSLFRLLRYKLKIFLARFLRGRARRKYVTIAFLVVILAAFVGFIFGARAFFTTLRYMGDEGGIAADAIVAIALHALLVIAFVFDIATTMNIFFLSGDLDLLLASPLSTIKVFVVKYLEALGAGSFISLFIGFPVVLGYGLAFEAPLIFYVAVIPVMFVFLTIPVSIGTLSGFIICRFAPASRIREILSFVGGIIGVGFWILIQVLRPSLSQQGGIEGLGTTMQTIASGGSSLMLRLLPSNLAAQTLIRTASRRFIDAAPHFLYLIAFSGMLLVISMVAAQRMYLIGWARVRPVGTRKRRPRPRSLIRMIAGWLPSMERAVYISTAHLFVRDPQQITPIASITVMMGLFPFLLSRSRGAALIEPRLLLYSVAALTFVGSMNLAMNATVIDGRSFWRILAAPTPAPRKVLAKFLVPTLFFLPLGAALAVALCITGVVGRAFVPAAIWLAACTTSVGSSVGIFLGISYGDWEWDIPKRMLRASGRLIMSGVIALFFVGTSIGLSFISSFRGLSMSSHLNWIVFPIITLVAALVTYVLTSISSRKIATMEWNL